MSGARNWRSTPSSSHKFPAELPGGVIRWYKTFESSDHAWTYSWKRHKPSDRPEHPPAHLERASKTRRASTTDSLNRQIRDEREAARPFVPRTILRKRAVTAP